ncbi:MAG: MFS transporter [Simkania sp.]|nr:MFS transporter [Simkania sp.]
MTVKKQSIETFYPHPRPYFAWGVWLAATLFILILYLIEFSIWDAQSPLMGKKLNSPHSLQDILTPYLIATILFQIPVSFMIDEWGPTKVVGCVMLISTIGILILGLSDSNAIFWIALFITGIGATVSYANAFKFISNWFSPRKFPLIVGGTICIAHLGATFGQPLTNYFLSHFQWTTTFINYGIVGIIYALFFFAVLRNSSPGTQYNVYANQQLPSAKNVIVSALKNRENWLIALAFGLLEGHRITFVGFWHITFLEVFYKISPDEGAYLNTPCILAYAFGALFFGWLAMRKKIRKKLIIIGAILAAVANFIPIYIPGLSDAIIVILFCISSFSAGAFFLSASLIHEKNIPQITATVIGMLVISLAFFRLLTNWIVSGILDFISSDLSLSSYSPIELKITFLIFPLSALIGLLLLSRVKDTYGKQSLTP